MRILYDHQIFTMQYYGGISRYFCEIMDRFSREPEIEFRLALRYSLNEILHQKPRLNRFWTCRNDLFTDSQFFSNLQKTIHLNVLNHIFNNKQEAVRRLKEQDFEVFHPTYYDPYFLKYLGKCPYILTMYDMTHEQYPANFDSRDATTARKKLLAENAKEIIAISENTKADIVKFLDVDPGKIQVIPLASSLNPENVPWITLRDRARNLPEKYLLFIGNRISYKNFAFLVKALCPVFESHGELHLVCAGGGKFSGPEMELLRKMNMTSRVHLCPADDATLVQLYRNAYAFVFPSLYEGFGIPVLEAFSCRCPAVLSNTGSLPEVGADAALYFDPADETSLRDVIERILSDEHLRDGMIEKGLERVTLFSWEKTAVMTKKVYSSAIE
jgi:glycosyltransferase involved in cell wall biosynthesis